MNNQTTKAESVRYLKMALALSGIAVDSFTTELIIDTWEAIEKKGGSFSIKDSVEIEWRARQKFKRVIARAATMEQNKKDKLKK